MDRAQPSASHGERHPALAALSESLEDGIRALVDWDMYAFGAAVERQGALCAELAAAAQLCARFDKDDLRRTRELAWQYRYLLRHSSQWARSMRSILLTGGYDPNAGDATLHLRG